MGLRRIKAHEGQIFWFYVFLYGVTRPVIELFRGDDRGMIVGGTVSTSQLIGVIMAAVAVAMLIILRRRN